MKATQNKVILKPVDREVEHVSFLGRGFHIKKASHGLFVPIKTTNEYDAEVVEQYAEVVDVCDTVVENVGQDKWQEWPQILKKGDIVITHHFLRDKQQGTDLKSLYYWQVFAKVDGERLVPTCQNNFLRPVEVKREEEQNGSLIIPGRSEVTNLFGEVVFPSQSLRELGVGIEDVVLLTGNTAYGAEYDILFGGETLICVPTDEVGALVKMVGVNAIETVDAQNYKS